MVVTLPHAAPDTWRWRHRAEQPRPSL